MNQKLVLLLLQKLGYRADLAANGVEVLEALERQPYDVVLMDVQMPEMDGLEATRRIHQRWSRERRPRIIAVTANAMAGERELCLQAGMDDYMIKPIRLDELAGALTKVARRLDTSPRAVAVDEGVVHRLVSSLGEQGAGAVAGLIDTFLGHAPGQMTTIATALDQADVEVVRREAHTLKANAVAFGALPLSELCRELEGAAKAGTLERGPGLLDQIGAELARVAVELGRIRTELGK